MTIRPSYRAVTLPSFGLSSDPSRVPVSDYEERLNRLRARCLENADAIVIYRDREHKGNIMYFLGFDPRFEEALLIVDAEGPPRLIVGNEGMGASYKARPEIERLLCQSFSLMGQDRTSEGNRRLGSGLMFQCDMIPVGDVPFMSWTCNVEDAVCRADKQFREELYSTYPDVGLRIDARREFLESALGIHPSPDLLPLSHIPAYFAPLVLSREHVLSFAA